MNTAALPHARSLTRFRWMGTGVAGALCGLLLVGALSPAFLPIGWRMLPMTVFHAFCHQLSDRSPHVDGVQLAVCWRCLGIYAGLVIGALLLPLVGRGDVWINRNAKWLLLGALVLTGLDWAGPVVGYWDNTWLSRMATGGGLGAVAGYLFARALAVAFRGRPQIDEAAFDRDVSPHPPQVT